MKLSLVIPSYNEISALPKVREMLNQLIQTNQEKKTFSKIDLIIVDDGSSDGSELVLPTWQDCRLIRHEKSLGYGAALKTGFANALGDVVGFMDMDSSYVPLEFIRLAEALQQNKWQCAFGSRTRQESGMPSIRKLGNWLYADGLKALCGSSLTDVCTGQRLFRRELLPLALALPQNDLSYSVALTVSILNQRLPIGEIPVSYLTRDGESKLSVVSDGFGFLFTILRTKYGAHAVKHRHIN